MQNRSSLTKLLHDRKACVSPIRPNQTTVQNIVICQHTYHQNVVKYREKEIRNRGSKIKIKKTKQRKAHSLSIYDAKQKILKIFG